MKKFKKTWNGMVRKSEIKFLGFKDHTFAGEWIGDEKDKEFDDDIPVRITIAEK